MRICPDCAGKKDPIDFARSSPRCRACAATRRKEQKARASRKYKALHRAPAREKLAPVERRRLWRLKNKDKIRISNRNYYACNREKENVRARLYKAKNREELNAKCADYWRARPEVNRFNRSIRRALEKRAMPSWADRKKMKEIYAEASRITRETGIPHHVDHFYPLQSDVVCGLHVETNLQILTGRANQSKRNKMPDAAGIALQ